MGVGLWQLLVILLVILILFGAGKLPSVMSDLGKGIRNLKLSLQEKDQDEDNKNEK